MLADGRIRRIGAVPNHYALGYRANGMSVWDVDDDDVDELGARVGALAYVTIATAGRGAFRVGRTTCSQWCTAPIATKLLRSSRALPACSAPPARRSDVLYSTRILKKTGLRLGVEAIGCAPTMFRMTQYLQEMLHPTPVSPRRDPPGPVVIWNLVRRCNLACQHCYSISADVDFPGELTTAESTRRWTTCGRSACRC